MSPAMEAMLQITPSYKPQHRAHIWHTGQSNAAWSTARLSDTFASIIGWMTRFASIIGARTLMSETADNSYMLCLLK